MKNVSPERWRQIEALLDGALDREPEARAAYLLEACGDDSALRQEVEKFLQAEEEAPSFLEEQALAFAHPFLPDLTEESGVEDSAAGERVGSYRLLEVAGRGGMATVYRAERAEGGFEQEVAIKLLPPGKGTKAVLRRFEHEEQVLASLSQPNIARLYDGGITDDGRPYFVMEYVAGQPIDQYCDAHRLSIKARLRLFRTVTEAVHYAHRNLVVHRDLKPSNILVTENGTVKLLDFGIAKFLEGNEHDAALLTRTGERWMTPGYAAPEQVRSEPITTATDVYQLGVVLYELLTGHRPYRIGEGSTYEIERAICEDEPTRPSTVVTRPVNATRSESPTELTPEAVSEARSTRVEQLRRDLSGDLDAIILKALLKEPEARYSSAEAFADDIEQYLDSQPVEARRGGGGYRARKFLSRHRQGVVATALVLLLGALAVVIWQRTNSVQFVDRVEELFYDLKRQELALAQLRLIPEEFREANFEARFVTLDETRRLTEEQYNGLVDQAGVYKDITQEELEIYRVVRIFNESEFTMPPSFVGAVLQHISYWQQTDRFERAIRRAQENGYIPVIVETFEGYGLPPEFFYLALQESDFDHCAVGPQTPAGIPKGMWQFTPETGRRYGLVIGPQADQSVCDPQDERYDYVKDTDAAARYLLDIYTQQAEASGLLALASYNWGEHRVITRLEGLVQSEEQVDFFGAIPHNPSQRSYWRFLEEYQDGMPRQTREFVLYIVSVAVIGQNPRLFGFDFDNPLAPHLAGPHVRQ